MTYFIGPIRKVSQAEYDNMSAFLVSEIEKAERRVTALKMTRERDPEWKYLDEYADDFKTIGMLIEEWEAVLWGLRADWKELNAKFYAPKQGILI